MPGREQKVREMGLHMLHGRAILLLQRQRQMVCQSGFVLNFHSQIGSQRLPHKR